tara:strand:- start:122470 stop:123579 length:1110 start_codon:yes stop_codon:yes gene_type:complete
MTLIRIDADSNEWDEIVRSMNGHSVYQFAAYHRLAAQMDGGSARLFFFEKGSRRIAIPLIIRDIPSSCLRGDEVLRDATSVYGYPGILSNTDDAPAEFIDRFQFVLQEEMRRENVVTVFVRLGAFRNSIELIRGLGDVEKIGDTVAIDLSLCDETRFRGYRRNHRQNISQLRRLGAKTHVDVDYTNLSRFENAYRLSMQRVGANDWFTFGLPYFDQLCTSCSDDVVLLQTMVDDEFMCGGLFFSSGDVAYAHLTATADEWVGKSPTKVLFEDAASFFKQRGCRWLHLGGGLGAREDNLYRFKCGFSDQRFPFHVWKYVVDMKRYQELCRPTRIPSMGDKYESFFPQYRAVASDCSRREPAPSSQVAEDL